VPNQIDLSLSILPSPRTAEADLAPDADFPHRADLSDGVAADSVALAAVAALHSGASFAGPIEDQDWHGRALCAQTDPEAFFPEKGGSTRDAKKICTGCEVRSECLSYALANDERFGIWGGLSERERRRLKRLAG
jgi:WhiB family redox-sensing transcriptional regulator